MANEYGLTREEKNLLDGIPNPPHNVCYEKKSNRYYVWVNGVRFRITKQQYNKREI